MILYKYLPYDRYDYFESELLRFTQPADLNDAINSHTDELLTDISNWFKAKL